MQPSMETLALAKAGNNEAMRCMYLDYVNDFLTVAGFAAYYGLGQRSAETYLIDWRFAHEDYCHQQKHGVTLAYDPLRTWFPHHKESNQ